MTSIFKDLLREYESRMEREFGQPEEEEIGPELVNEPDYEEQYQDRKERGLFP